MNPTQSLTDLPDFPYATYDEFLEAHRQGQALVWVRPDLRAAWRLGGTDDRVMYLFLFGAAWLIAAAFAFFAYRQHNGWQLDRGRCSSGCWHRRELGYCRSYWSLRVCDQSRRYYCLSVCDRHRRCAHADRQ